MIIEISGMKITTDKYQFIVQEKKVLGTGEDVKEENRGKEYWSNTAYVNTLESALKYIAKRIVLDNEDVIIILKELRKLEGEIKKFSDKFELNL